jgi:transcriptional regulator NrdR family protein
MNCPKCSQKTRVLYTSHCANHVHRRRACTVCGLRFSTDETEVVEGPSGTGGMRKITKYRKSGI